MSDPTLSATGDGTSTVAPDPVKSKLDPQLDGEKKFTQAEFDSKLAEQVKAREERIKRQMEAQQREQQAALEAKQLEDQAEWQKLANQRAEQIKELKPRAALAENYEKAVKALVEAQTRDVPVAIQTILEKLSLTDQLDWLTANAGALKPQAASGSTNTNAYNRSASAAAGLTDDEYREKKRRELNYH